MTADETGAQGAQDARGLGELTHPSAPERTLRRAEREVARLLEVRERQRKRLVRLDHRIAEWERRVKEAKAGV